MADDAQAKAAQVEIVVAALTQGLACLVGPGLALAARALSEAKDMGATVHITVAFSPDGSVSVAEPRVIIPAIAVPAAERAEATA